MYNSCTPFSSSIVAVADCKKQKTRAHGVHASGIAFKMNVGMMLTIQKHLNIVNEF